uniref:Uncharacterized protein n=1 Tax=Arundo donax TaxID=35708 RepID=A0A0A9ARB3_ARUDO
MHHEHSLQMFICMSVCPSSFASKKNINMLIETLAKSNIWDFCTNHFPAWQVCCDDLQHTSTTKRKLVTVCQ